jgi:hypothetical protein
MVELLCIEPGDLIDRLGVGNGLSGERLAVEKTPPAFLGIEPAGALGNDDASILHLY